MFNRAGIAALVMLPRCSAVCKPVYLKSMHARPIGVPCPLPAGGLQRRERRRRRRRRRIGEDVASAAAVATAASSFLALKRPPAEIITQQQHHRDMILDATHSVSSRRLATSRDYTQLPANPDYNSNATGISRATIRE
jgi:hypothetical protein